LGVDLSELRVEVTHVGQAVSLDELHGAHVLRWGTCEVAVSHGVDVRVTEGEDLLSGGEHNKCHVGSTESAKLTGFLEESGTALGEGDLEVALVAHFLHLDLLTATAFLCV